MKVFLSWSGETSKQVAVALGEFLSAVIQAIEPWQSTEIERGSRWPTEIEKALDEIDFAIVCITPQNLRSPWLHYEAGALASRREDPRVTPFLVGVTEAEVGWPLAQFQMTTTVRDDVFGLVEGLNRRLSKALSEKALERSFELHWEDFAQRVAELAKTTGGESPVRDSVLDARPPQAEDPLAEVVVSVRELLRRSVADGSVTKRKMIFGRPADEEGRPARPVTRRAIARGMSRRLGTEFPPDRVELQASLREFGEHRVPVELPDGTVFLLNVAVREKREA